MKNRTTYANNINYKYYGGRGIKVCAEWSESFDNFYNWARQHEYKDSLTISRIDNDGDYTPDNCKWETMKAQCNNRRIKTPKTINNNALPYNIAGRCYKLGMKQIELVEAMNNRGIRLYATDFSAYINGKYPGNKSKQVLELADKLLTEQERSPRRTTNA